MDDSDDPSERPYNSIVPFFWDGRDGDVIGPADEDNRPVYYR